MRTRLYRFFSGNIYFVTKKKIRKFLDITYLRLSCIHLFVGYFVVLTSIKKIISLLHNTGGIICTILNTNNGATWVDRRCKNPIKYTQVYILYPAWQITKITPIYWVRCETLLCLCHHICIILCIIEGIAQYWLIWNNKSGLFLYICV